MTYNASIFGFPIIAIGFGFMVLSAISPSSFLYKWKSKTTTFIATLSYAIYLTHKGIIHITILLLTGFKINDNLILIISIALSLVFAYLLYFIIEKPFMKVRDKLLYKTK